MPYITQEVRDILDNFLPSAELTEGELNYFITKMLLQQNPQSYADYNALIGVLESCKLEFYRRAVAAYEDEKSTVNGDVYS